MTSQETRPSNCLSLIGVFRSSAYDIFSPYCNNIQNKPFLSCTRRPELNAFPFISIDISNLAKITFHECQLSTSRFNQFPISLKQLIVVRRLFGLLQQSSCSPKLKKKLTNQPSFTFPLQSRLQGLTGQR